MNQEILLALKSMGYRLDNNLWLKPVGHCIFVYSPDAKTWRCLFQKSSKEELLCWDSHEFDEVSEIFIQKLKDWEADSRVNLNRGSKFEFLTLREKLEIELDL